MNTGRDPGERRGGPACRDVGPCGRGGARGDARAEFDSLRAERVEARGYAQIAEAVADVARRPEIGRAMLEAAANTPVTDAVVETLRGLPGPG